MSFRGVTRFEPLQQDDASPLLRPNSNKSHIHQRLGNRLPYTPPNGLPNGHNQSQQHRFNVGGSFRTDSNIGPPNKMKKMQRNMRNSFYSNPRQNNLDANQSSSGQDQGGMAQNRLKRIRSTVPPEDTYISYAVSKGASNDAGVDDLDATDITIEVLNDNAVPVQKDEQPDLTRFKMVLDTRCQAAIKKLQSALRDKQVIIPSPVTPHVTTVTTNERFSVL